jgi:hypothetical protein
LAQSLFPCADIQTRLDFAGHDRILEIGLR